PSPIPVEDSDSHMEEIDLFLATDDSMPPGIENDDYYSEGDIRSQEELLSNYSPPLPKNESSNLDHFNDLSSPRLPPEPPNVKICFDVEPDTTVKNDFDELNEDEFQSERLLSWDEFSISFTRDPLFDTLIPFLSENEDKVFNPGILASPFLSHRDKITSDFSENPMMMYGGDIPLLDVPCLHFYPP
ncbi:hypothetical protein Tco_0240708, partial [Tanacetum coccineum]